MDPFQAIQSSLDALKQLNKLTQHGQSLSEILETGPRYSRALSTILIKNDEYASLTLADQADVEIIPDFDMHYDQANSNDILEILGLIQQDLSSFSSVHDWDRKLRHDPVKALARSVRLGLLESRSSLRGHTLYSSGVDTVCTYESRNHRRPGATEMSSVKDYVFPSKVSPRKLRNYAI